MHRGPIDARLIPQGPSVPLLLAPYLAHLPFGRSRVAALVHEALAAEVHIDARGGDETTRVGVGVRGNAWGKLVGEERGVHACARGHAHERAGALLVGGAVGGEQGAIVEQVGQGGRHEALQNLLVAREATRVHEHGGVCFEGDRIAVGIYGFNANHGSALNDQARCLGAKEELRSIGCGGIGESLGDLGAAPRGDHVHARDLGGHVGVELAHSARGAQVCRVEGDALRDKPVDGLSAVLGKQTAQLGLLGTLSQGLKQFIVLVDRVFDARLLLHGGAAALDHTGAQRAVGSHDGIHNLKHNDVGAFGGADRSRSEAAGAGAYNDDVRFAIPPAFRLFIGMGGGHPCGGNHAR